MLAKIIVIEGADACGKTTQAKMLAHSLRRYGDKVSLVEIPYNDKITHKLIYKMLYNGYAKKYPNAFQFLQFINKFVCQIFCLSYKMFTCDYIVLARWSLSSLVYGVATGVSERYLKILQSILISPDLTIVLDGKSHKRTSRNDDSYEKDSILQHTVKMLYRAEGCEKIDHVLINCENSIDEVHNRIMKEVVRL